MDDHDELEQKRLARDVLRCLTLGLHPITRKPLPDTDILHEQLVIRAMILAVEALEAINKASTEIERPSRAGQAWNAVEDNELIDEFAQRLPPKDISETHKRSSGSIIARLVRLKLVNERDDARRIFEQIQ